MNNFHMIIDAGDLVKKVADYHFVKSYQTYGNPDHLRELVEKAFDFDSVSFLIKDLNMFLLASRTVYDSEHGETNEHAEAFRYLREKARESIVARLFAHEINCSYKRDAMTTIERFLKTLWLPKEEENDEEEKDEEEDEKPVTFTFEATLVPEKQ